MIERMADDDLAGNYLLEAPDEVMDAYIGLRLTMAKVAEESGRDIECLTESPLSYRGRSDLSFIAFAYPSALYGYHANGRVLEQRGSTVLMHSAEGKTEAATSAEAPGRLMEFVMRGAPEHVDFHRN